MEKNSNTMGAMYAILSPDQLAQALRGGYFPRHQCFVLPDVALTDAQTLHFVGEHFPAVSHDRSDVTICFRSGSHQSSGAFRVTDIIEVRFYNSFRQDAASNQELVEALRAFFIPVGAPLEASPQWPSLFDAYDHILRDAMAKTICAHWYDEVEITTAFSNQVRLGFRHQQAASARELEPLLPDWAWAHLVAYNAGRRPFEERPKVLGLQDAQVAIKGMGGDLKARLKEVGERCDTSFGKEVDRADGALGAVSKWLAAELKNQNSYFAQVDQILSGGIQQSFLASAVLYLRWRTALLDGNYRGFLANNSEVKPYLNRQKRSKGELQGDFAQAILEALYTIVYIGGPASFSSALRETRAPSNPLPPPPPPPGPSLAELLASAPKKVGKALDNLLKKNSVADYNPKSIKELLGVTRKKVQDGEISEEDVLTLCEKFDVPVESVLNSVVQGASKRNKWPVSSLFNSKASVE